MAVASYFDTVQKLYIAFYQRPADPAGLYYWAQQLDAAKGDQTAVIDAFANSAEAIRLYDTNADSKIDNTDASKLLDQVFQALFNRAPDVAGKKFYTDALAAGKFPDGRVATVGRVVLDVLNGATTGNDAVAVANKLDYSNGFTKTLDPELDGIGPFSATYNGQDEAASRTLLNSVTSDPATRKSSAQIQDDIKTKIANVGDPIVGGPDTVKPVVTAQAGIKTYAENQAATAVLETVTATDNVAVTGYKIVSGNDAGLFQISADGKIGLTAAGASKTAASNDFETTPNDFVLGVQAMDAAGNTSATVNYSLRVTDVDDRAPVLTGAVVNGTKATLSYDETLDATKQPAIFDYVVTIGSGGSIAVTSVQVTGNTVVLTLGRAANPGEVLNVTYVPGTTVVSDAAGNGVAQIGARPLVVDTTAPVITAGQAISYAEDIVTGVPATRTVDTVLGKVAATDDTGVTAYNITAGNEAGFFAIDGAGNIRLTAAGLKGAANDFEVAPNSFVLTVTASDGAGNISAAQQVTLNVTNVTSDDAAAPPVAQVIQMTTGNDNVSPTGTIGTSRTSDANDTIAAFWDGTAQNAANSGTTIGLGDTFDAAGGTADKLILTLSSAAELTNAAAPVLNNLEILEVRSTGAAGTALNLTGISPNLTTLNFDASSVGSTVQGVANAVSTFGLTNTNTVVNQTLLVKSASGLAGNADAVTLNLSNNAALQKAGGTGTTLQIAGSAATAGYELVTVNSTGAASAIKALSITDSANTATATTLTVNGTANLTIDTALDFLGTKGTVNANNFSGNLNIALTKGEDVTVTGGSGNDRFNFADGLTLADKINGGTGNDTIAVSVALNAAGVVIDAINAATSVEQVEQTADYNLQADLFTSVKSFVFSGDAAANVTNTVNANTFAFSGQNVKGTFAELTASANDVLNLSFTRAAGATLTGNVGGAGYETVNVALNNTTGVFDGANNTFTLAAGGTLVVTGAGSVSQAAAGNGITLGAAANINASAATGKLNLNGEGGANNLQGGTNDDLIAGNAGNDTILGNGGNDTITGGADADQLTGGAGNDTFIIGAAGDTRSAAFAATNTTTANIDRITDFVGNGNLAGDTIQVAAAQATFGNAAAGAPVSVTAFTVANANTFNDLAGALAGIQASTNALLSVADITVSAGTLAGRYVIINDGAAGYTAGTDAIIGLTGVTGALHAQDFTVV